jgi:hypothetical protein
MANVEPGRPTVHAIKARAARRRHGRGLPQRSARVRRTASKPCLPGSTCSRPIRTISWCRPSRCTPRPAPHSTSGHGPGQGVVVNHDGRSSVLLNGDVYGRHLSPTNCSWLVERPIWFVFRGLTLVAHGRRRPLWNVRPLASPVR